MVARLPELLRCWVLAPTRLLLILLGYRLLPLRLPRGVCLLLLVCTRVYDRCTCSINVPIATLLHGQHMLLVGLLVSLLFIAHIKHIWRRLGNWEWH